MTLTIRVPGEPVAWAHAQRPIHGKTGHGAMATYIPSRVRQWQDQVASFAQKAATALGWTKPEAKVPLRVDVDFHFHRPSGYRKAEIWKRTKPDRDKLDRAVLDSLTWAGMIHDDAQIVDGRIRKLIDDEWQGAVITVTPLSPTFTPISATKSQEGLCFVQSSKASRSNATQLMRSRN